MKDIIIWIFTILFLLFPIWAPIIITIGTIKIIKNILKSSDSKVVKLLEIITIFIIDIFMFALVMIIIDNAVHM